MNAYVFERDGKVRVVEYPEGAAPQVPGGELHGIPGEQLDFARPWVCVRKATDEDPRPISLDLSVKP